MQAPVASAYGSGGEEDEEAYEFELDVSGARISASQTKFMRPLMGGTLIAAPRKRRRNPPASPRDRERDRDADASEMPPVPMPPPGPVPPALFESEWSRNVERMLGPSNGMEACFSCRAIRGNQLLPPAARTGLDMMTSLLRTATSGATYIALAREMHIVFTQHVRDPMNRMRREGEEMCPDWLPRDIYDHFFTPYHRRLDAVQSQANRVMMLETALAKTEQFLLYEESRLADGTLVQVPRPEMVAMLIRTSGELSKLYAQRQSSFSLAAADAPTTTTAAGITDSRRALIGPAPRRHA